MNTRAKWMRTETIAKSFIVQKIHDFISKPDARKPDEQND